MVVVASLLRSILHEAVISTEINPAVIVVTVWLRRLGDRERDVVPTIVITPIAGVLVKRWYSSNTFSVQRLQYWLVLLWDPQTPVLRFQPAYFLFHERDFAGIFSNTEVLLHFFSDNRKSTLFFRLLPASKVVISENLNILVLLEFSVHGVDKKNWR